MAQISATRSNNEQQQPSNQNNMGPDSKSPKTNMGKVKPSYKHIPHSQKPPHLVAKRNARERRRVQAVNQAFYKLRKSVPIENRNKRVSKVKTLQRAIDYIRKLERILAEDVDEQPGGSVTRSETNCQPSVPTSGAMDAARSKTQPVQGGVLSNSKEISPNQESREVTSEKVQMNDIASNRRASGRASRKQQTQAAGKSKHVQQPLPDQQQQQINQVARVQQRRTQQDTSGIGISGAVASRQENNNYTVCMKPATTVVADSEFFDSATSNAALVSYGKGQASGRNVGPSPTVSQQHFPSSNNNHYGQYYIDSPTSSSQLMVESLSSQQFAYNIHPQLPPSSFQGCEISSSSLMTNGPLYGGYPQGAGAYQYGPLDGGRTSLALSANQQHGQHDNNNHHHYHQRLVNHEAANKPVESTTITRTSIGSQRYQQQAPVDAARHYQDSPRNIPANGQIKQYDKTAQAKMMMLLENSSLINTAQELEQPAQGNKLVANNQKQHGLEIATMPADSTSSVAMKDARGRATLAEPVSARSSPTSMSSSSTTTRSLDLSGGGSNSDGTGGSSLFDSANMDGGDKSPTTSVSTPAACRQRKSGQVSRGGGGGGAHSTFGRGNFVRRQVGDSAADGHQQVNNYNSGELPNYAAAHLLYETPSSNSITANYLRVGQNQMRQPPSAAEQTIKLAECKSRPAASSHEASPMATAANNLELLQRHRSGSRSSSSISPDPATQQLVLVGGNYLANNNLHGNDQHSGQLFQQHQPPAHYNNYQQHDHYHQIQHQNHNSHHQNPGQQPSLYQGQHFLGNLQSGHQQLNSNHLNDHNNHHHHHHHLQADSFLSGLRQPNANTLELVTASNMNPHQQLERLVAGNSTQSITAPPAQYTVQSL